jgi:hypothetical protein
MGNAQLQQHLGSGWQPEAVPDQGADSGGLQRLGVQAREYPSACGMQQKPLQRLASAEPVGPAITGCEQNGRHGRGRRVRPLGEQLPQAAAEVEVTLA